MSWKKALFFGGAVLLLAACDRATAPSPELARVEGPKAAAKTLADTTSRTTMSFGTTTETIGPMCNGFVIRTGLDSTCVSQQQ